MNEEKNKTSLDNNSVPDENGMSSAIFNKKHNHYTHSNCLHLNGGEFLAISQYQFIKLKINQNFHCMNIFLLLRPR